jgi:GNAT superfamily N-acetyltransferase
MKIRRYRFTDHDAVWELHNVALLQAGAHAGNGPWDDDLHCIDAEYIAPGGEFFVGTASGRVVAMGALLRLSTGQASIRRMRVHPDIQRRGLGKQMLSALERRATELGFRTLTLETTVQQVPAIQLYTRSGYKEVGRSWKASFEVVEFKKEIG